jgi:ketosteroid isomerase-like protein
MENGTSRDTARAMSQENVELIQQGFAHVMATGEAPTHLLHPGIEVHDHDAPDQSDYRGHGGFARWLRDWNAAWATWRIEPERFIEADDRVVVIYRMTVEGKGSGVQLERHEGQVWTIREGLAFRVDAYGSGDEALEAAGLSE